MKTPKEFALHQCYVNHYDTTAVIIFDLPKKSNVTLTIYDNAGKELATLVKDQELQAGIHQFEYDKTEEFFYKIIAKCGSEIFSAVKKCLPQTTI